MKFPPSPSTHSHHIPWINHCPHFGYSLRRPDIFRNMMTTMGQSTDACPWPHLRKNTHFSPYLWCWAVKHNVSANADQSHAENALCISLLLHSGRTGNLDYLTPLPTSDKDEWFAVFILISGHFSQPLGCGPFPSTALACQNQRSLCQLRTTACKSGFCDSMRRTGLPRENVGSFSQGCSQLLIYNHFLETRCKIQVCKSILFIQDLLA